MTAPTPPRPDAMPEEPDDVAAAAAYLRYLALRSITISEEMARSIRIVCDALNIATADVDDASRFRANIEIVRDKYIARKAENPIGGGLSPNNDIVADLSAAISLMLD